MNTEKINQQWIQDIAEKAAANLKVLPEGGIIEVYMESEQHHELSTFASVRIKNTDFLLIVAEDKDDYGFKGESTIVYDHQVMLCHESKENISALRKLFAILNPSIIGKKKNTFGVGDRLGIAGPGHLRVFKKFDIVPVLAQQSLRELELTGRKYSDVIDAASWAVFKTGYKGLWAADGDHLKNASDVSSAVEQGCTMITADLSDHIDFSIHGRGIDEITSLYNQLNAHYRERIENTYSGKISIGDGLVLDFKPETIASIVLTYKNAIEHADLLYKSALEHRDSLDFEISIDETELPTTFEAHYFVAKELEVKGIKYSSIAPRYIGEFQKGIDYIGELDEFEADFKGHALIAAESGYKISIHSSSDKFSAYPIIARNRKGAFHLKTSGTNWLTALEVVALKDPDFFREIFDYAYEIFPVARAYYHVTPDMGIKTDISRISDDALIDVFINPTDRQVLHISYGEVFKKSDFKQRMFEVFNSNLQDYWSRLEKHIGRHVELLNV